MKKHKNNKLSRRDAIKLLGAAAGATALANLPSKWSKPSLASGALPAHAQTSLPSSPTLPTVLTVSIIPSDPSNSPTATFNGDITSDGGSPILDQGFVWDLSPNNNPDLSNTVISLGAIGTGAYTTGSIFVSSTTGPKYGRAYATNAVGTAYGAVLAFTTGLCLVEGTLVTLADGTKKKIEDVEYSDWFKVWNFDEGCFDEARPLWIMRSATAPQYLQFEFSDGSSLNCVVHHRIFNKDMGEFGYPMTEDAPLGTTTFNDMGGEIKLVGMRVVNEQINYYNVITYRHMNLFADGILTSCRYNNIYPIVDMKFVKDDRVLVPQEEYGVEDNYYEGLRLAEQNIPVEATVAYVNRLKTHKMEADLVLA